MVKADRFELPNNTVISSFSVHALTQVSRISSQVPGFWQPRWR